MSLVNSSVKSAMEALVRFFVSFDVELLQADRSGGYFESS